MVAACFGIPPIRSPLGVHAAAAVRHNVDSHDCAPVTDKSTEALAGGAFEFRGLRIVLAWTDKSLEPFIRHLGSSVPAFDGWRESMLLHPFRGMNFTVGDRRARSSRSRGRPSSHNLPASRDLAAQGIAALIAAGRPQRGVSLALAAEHRYVGSTANFQQTTPRLH